MPSMEVRKRKKVRAFGDADDLVTRTDVTAVTSTAIRLRRHFIAGLLSCETGEGSPLELSDLEGGLTILA